MDWFVSCGRFWAVFPRRADAIACGRAFAAAGFVPSVFVDWRADGRVLFAFRATREARA